MIIIKPEWVTHADRTQDTRNKKPCIYSVDVHPDGQRLATGSLDGNVKIWNTEPIFDERAETDPECHKLLCTMTMHNGAVLCVRWSHGEGRYLASSSDNDNVIIIWERDRNASAGAVFGSSDVNHESWKAIKYLRGHESDVQDLAWSKDNQYLASCGVDGFVIVWDGSTFEQITKIDQHGGFVKGVTWDPAGKFLASQSDDKMVKVWRTTDWGLETEIMSPFINAPGTTFFRRLSWAPDGTHIAAANAVNGLQCIAAMINRDDWNSDVSLVGHQLPVEVTCYNPKMFYMAGVNPEGGVDSGTAEDSMEDTTTTATERSPSNICALGSQDRSVSIWMTKFNRPVCVAADIFDNNIYDIAWTPDGKSLFACSQDGTVACISLADELRDVVPDDYIYKELAKYGYGRKNTQLPETPTQLALEEENAIMNKASSSKRLAGLMSGDTSIASSPSAAGATADVIMVDAKPLATNYEQNGTTTATAKALATAAEITSSSTTASSSKSTVLLEQKISIAKNGKRRIQPVMLSPSASSETTSNKQNMSNANHRSHPTAAAPTTTTTIASSHRTGMANHSTHVRKSASDISNMEYDDLTIIPNSGINVNIHGGNKRKAQDNLEEPGNEIGARERDRYKPEWMDSAVPPPNIQKSQVQMGLPKIKSVLTAKTRPDDPTVVMECHNSPSSHNTNALVRTKVVTSKQGMPIWTDYLPSAVMLMTGNQFMSAVACEDGSLQIYTPSGRRYLPPILLESTAVVLNCSSQWLLCLTATGLLYTWDILSFKSALHGVSIAPLLQVALFDDDNELHKAPSIKDIKIQKKNGLPIVITSQQQAFVYHVDMKVWLRISDAWYIISEFWGSGLTAFGQGDLKSAKEDHPLGWLSSKMTITNNMDSTTKLIADLARADESTTASITISHLETQLAVAALLESPNEYKEWMLNYARKLSEENAKDKVEELCRWLTGPPFVLPSEFVKWEPTIMGTLLKRDLLKQILPVLAQNRQLQRTVTEFKSCLE